jgi:hypothetical protein
MADEPTTTNADDIRQTIGALPGESIAGDIVISDLAGATTDSAVGGMLFATASVQPGLSLWDGSEWVSLDVRVRQLVAEALQTRVTEALLAMDQEGRDQIRVFMDALAARGL